MCHAFNPYPVGGKHAVERRRWICLPTWFNEYSILGDFYQEKTIVFHSVNLKLINFLTGLPAVLRTCHEVSVYGGWCPELNVFTVLLISPTLDT